jgi:hypothetical protein
MDAERIPQRQRLWIPDCRFAASGMTPTELRDDPE